MRAKKDLDYYLNLNWTYTIEKESYEDKDYYIIRVNELPGVCTNSENIEEGLIDISHTIRATIELYIKNGEPIPEPIPKEKYKGNISYRTTPDRHYKLAKIAQRKHLSLSKALDSLIDSQS